MGFFEFWHGIDKYICNFCKKEFKSTVMERYYYTTHSEVLEVCPHCRFSTHFIGIRKDGSKVRVFTRISDR